MPGVPRFEKDQEATLLVAAFRQHLQRLGYGKSTVSMLPACVKEFFEIVPKLPSEIEKTDIDRYHQHLQNRPNKRRPGGLSERMIRHHLYALKSFFNWQVQRGEIIQHPMNNLQVNAAQNKPRQILTQAEIKQLYATAKTARERIILSLCYGCGLRRSEAENVNVKDVNLQSGLLYVRSGKGGKRRAVPLSEGVKRDIEHYLKARQAPASERALVVNRDGTRLRGGDYYKGLKKLLERAGIEKHISLHSLRHSIATHLLEGGLSVEYVRDFLGHRHLESTQLYTRINEL